MSRTGVGGKHHIQRELTPVAYFASVYGQQSEWAQSYNGHSFTIAT